MLDIKPYSSMVEHLVLQEDMGSNPIMVTIILENY